MMNIWGLQPRSTYHKTMVRRVNHYLKQKCSVADYEVSLVTGYRTDACGYDRKSKIWYLCEIKVDPSDLKKAPQQIRDTKYHFPETKYYHTGDTIVPVIAIPARLANDLVKTNEWSSLRNTCKMVNAAIWVIEQSTVREVATPTIKKARSTKRTKTPSTPKKKPATNKKRAAPKTSKATKTKNIKKKTTQPKPARSKKRVVKSSKIKKPKTKSTKRKTSGTRSAKSKVAKVKTRVRK